jgi:hypothetical protein
MGLLASMIALALRSRESRIVALALVCITALSAVAGVLEGEKSYGRLKGISDNEGEKWLDEHMRRAEQLIYASQLWLLIELNLNSR